MIEVFKALGFMLLGGLIANAAWAHAWQMYRKGKAEGQGVPLNNRPNGSRVVR